MKRHFFTDQDSRLEVQFNVSFYVPEKPFRQKLFFEQLAQGFSIRPYLAGMPNRGACPCQSDGLVQPLSTFELGDGIVCKCFPSPDMVGHLIDIVQI